jgi:hypothetical protein
LIGEHPWDVALSDSVLVEGQHLCRAVMHELDEGVKPLWHGLVCRTVFRCFGPVGDRRFKLFELSRRRNADAASSNG